SLAELLGSSIQEGQRGSVRTHLVTITGNLLLPRPARNERGEGHPVEWASSPQPSPPVGEEREPISSGRLVVVTRCARSVPQDDPGPPTRAPPAYRRPRRCRRRAIVRSRPAVCAS